MSRRYVYLLLVVVLALGVWGWSAKKAADERAAVERARVAAEIEAERAEQLAAAKAARDAKEAAEAAAREEELEAAREARAEAEAKLEGLRDVDRLLLLDWLGRDLGASKRTDVTRGRPYRVDVYQEAGRRTATHAHIDLDRDEMWDEKWTFEPDGGVRRQIAPADDEEYRVWEIWTGERWKREGS